MKIYRANVLYKLSSNQQDLIDALRYVSTKKLCKTKIFSCEILFLSQ